MFREPRSFILNVKGENHIDVFSMYKVIKLRNISLENFPKLHSSIFIYSLHNLPCDRSVAFSKASSPQSEV
jgi:hypothetical protein